MHGQAWVLEQVTHQLRALGALIGDMGSNPSMYMLVHNICKVSGYLTSSSDLQEHHASITWYTFVHADRTLNIHKMKTNTYFKTMNKA